MRILRVWVVVIVMSSFVASCGNAGDDHQEKTLTVYAASSLTDAFEDLGQAYEKDHPHTKIIFSFNGSSQLALQIIEGAPADIFASANLMQMANVQAEGRISADPLVFATNRLVLVTPANNPAAITQLKDIGRSGVKMVTALEGIPIREYTDTLLESLSGLDEYGADFADNVRGNFVSTESNVRQIVLKVALGEADAGIVYTSDVSADIRADVLIFEIPAEFAPVAQYTLAPITTSKNGELAQDFINFIVSDTGQAILAKWGFLPRP